MQRCYQRQRKGISFRHWHHLRLQVAFSYQRQRYEIKLFFLLVLKNLFLFFSIQILKGMCCRLYVYIQNMRQIENFAWKQRFCQNVQAVG